VPGEALNNDAAYFWLGLIFLLLFAVALILSATGYLG
jgi:hypothetical protein